MKRAKGRKLTDKKKQSRPAREFPLVINVMGSAQSARFIARIQQAQKDAHKIVLRLD